MFLDVAPRLCLCLCLFVGGEMSTIRVTVRSSTHEVDEIGAKAESCFSDLFKNFDARSLLLIGEGEDQIQ